MTGSTILLVDDDEVLNQVLRRVLTRDGYHVVEAGSVAQALERAREERPSLGLVDLRLPDGDGVELAQRLQKEMGHIPLILMTAYPLRLRDQPELAQSFRRVLTKPLNLDELRQAIESSLGASSGSRSASTPTPKPPTRAESAASERPEPNEAPPLTPAPARPEPKKGRLRWAIVAGIIVAVAGLAAAIPALGTPSIQRLLRPGDARLVHPVDEAHASLASDSDEEIELPPKVVERLGITTNPVSTEVAKRRLQLPGSLAFDPNHLASVQSRFAGEVIAIGTYENRDAANNSTGNRPLLYGDRVTKGQLLAVVLSKDLGEKKSELIDALVKLKYDESLLQRLEDLLKEGSTPPATVYTQRAVVGQGRNTVSKIEQTLETWRVAEKEIDGVREEAERVYKRQGKRDRKRESEWAKVEVRAPFDGTIVEKSVTLHKMVSTDFTLFMVADLRKLGVLVHAYEEDLRELQALPRGYPWEVRSGADPSHRVLESDGVQRIGLVVDPTQHTDPIMGLVDNKDGRLRVGQFVTATVHLPAPPNVVSLPSSAVEEDGERSIIFVQPDPTKPRYALRRVSVAMRLRDVVYVHANLSAEERKKGLREVKPGEYIVTEGVLELKAALEDLQAKARK
ncbi:MAG TPA: response regulator [Gemmataceae bacterium]|jgi:cobalt-zinc-cadmium efflux system membrane fusion protein